MLSLSPGNSVFVRMKLLLVERGNKQGVMFRPHMTAWTNLETQLLVLIINNQYKVTVSISTIQRISLRVNISLFLLCCKGL